MENIKNIQRLHFNDEVEHAKVNRYVEITAQYLQLFIKDKMKVLDVGAADGVLSRYLHASVDSIDIDPANKNVKKGTIYDMPFDYYDMIVYNHVLEHIENIYDEIRRASETVKKGGYIFIACPESSSPWAYNLDAHISLINKYVIEKICNKCNLHLIEQSYHCFRDNKIEIWNVLQK